MKDVYFLNVGYVDAMPSNSTVVTLLLCVLVSLLWIRRDALDRLRKRRVALTAVIAVWVPLSLMVTSSSSVFSTTAGAAGQSSTLLARLEAAAFAVPNYAGSLPRPAGGGGVDRRGSSSVRGAANNRTTAAAPLISLNEPRNISRAAIVYLTNEGQMARRRKNCKNIFESLASLARYLPVDDSSSSFETEVIILHETPLSEDTRSKIEWSSVFPVRFQSIQFERDDEVWLYPAVGNDGKEKRDSLNDFDKAYRRMCAFWFHYFFELDFLPDYVMRLDTDSCLTSPLANPFQYMAEHGADYMWHSTFKEPGFVIKGLQDFVVQNPGRPRVDHNNDVSKLWGRDNNPETMEVFSTNLELFYLPAFRRPEILEWKALVKANGGVMQYRWGDAPLRTIVATKFLNASRVVRFCEFHYNHSGWTPFSGCEADRGQQISDAYAWPVPTKEDTYQNQRGREGIQLFPDFCAAKSTDNFEQIDAETGAIGKGGHINTIGDYYNNAKWPPKVIMSASGVGSKLGYGTETSLGILRRAIKGHGVTSMIDLGCGDTNWIFDSWETDSLPYYLGLDISMGVIALNRKRFGFHKNKHFRYWDATRCTLPCYQAEGGSTGSGCNPFDLVHIRDVLQHLPLQQGIHMLCNTIRSGAKLLIATTYLDATSNNDISSARTAWYANNLELEPFGFPHDPSCALTHPGHEKDSTCVYDLRKPWVKEFVEKKCPSLY